LREPIPVSTIGTYQESPRSGNEDSVPRVVDALPGNKGSACERKQLLKVATVRIARFFVVQYTYQNGENIPKDHKIYHSARKYIQP
jgi:hypothetical protein